MGSTSKSDGHELSRSRTFFSTIKRGQTVFDELRQVPLRSERRKKIRIVHDAERVEFQRLKDLRKGLAWLSQLRRAGSGELAGSAASKPRAEIKSCILDLVEGELPGRRRASTADHSDWLWLLQRLRQCRELGERILERRPSPATA